MLPWNAGLNIKILSQTVDKIWHLAGDNSHDYNWYTKRTLLAGVYSSTLLVWLNDNSENLETTRDFLARRIENVLTIGKSINKFKESIA